MAVLNKINKMTLWHTATESIRNNRYNPFRLIIIFGGKWQAQERNSSIKDLQQGEQHIKNLLSMGSVNTSQIYLQITTQF
jgi:hypothetical protein